MSYKGSWARGSSNSYCIKNCVNRGKKCDECLRFSEFKRASVEDGGSLPPPPLPPLLAPPKVNLTKKKA